MDRAGVEKECGEKSETMETGRLRGNKAETRNDFMEIREGVYARGDNCRAKDPRDPGLSILHRGIEFDRHSEKGGDLFPPFIGRGAVEVAPFGFGGNPFYFFDGEDLARFLRELGRRRSRRQRHKRLDLAGVEPDEMAGSANIDLDDSAIGSRDF